MVTPQPEVGTEPAARLVVFETIDDPPSIVCNVAAAACSFVALAGVELVPRFSRIGFPAALADAWVLLVDLPPYNPIIKAAVGAAVLTVVGIGAQLFQRVRPFPDWAPLVLAWPAALILVGPSALEHADEWAAWLALGVLLALGFCGHWLCLLVAREAWD